MNDRWSAIGWTKTIRVRERSLDRRAERRRQLARHRLSRQRAAGPSQLITRRSVVRKRFSRYERATRSPSTVATRTERPKSRAYYACRSSKVTVRHWPRAVRLATCTNPWRSVVKGRCARFSADSGRCMPGGDAAVNNELGAGAVRRCIRSEVEHEFGDLVGHAESAQRHPLGE